MTKHFALAAVAVLTLDLSCFVFAACSSSNGNAPAVVPDASDDVTGIDAPLGPSFCGLPVPATCPTTAPCGAAAWGCAQTTCDGYFVVTDGTWIYYYALPSGELAGEVVAGDASFVSCPYGFVPPSCAPVDATTCADASSVPDASDSSVAPDSSSSRDASNPSDAPDVSSPPDGSESGSFSDGSALDGG